MNLTVTIGQCMKSVLQSIGVEWERFTNFGVFNPTIQLLINGCCEHKNRTTLDQRREYEGKAFVFEWQLGGTVVSQTANRENSKNRLRKKNNCARSSGLESIGWCKQITYNLLSSCEIHLQSGFAFSFHLESLSFHSKSVQHRHERALIEMLAEPCWRRTFEETRLTWLYGIIMQMLMQNRQRKFSTGV